MKKPLVILFSILLSLPAWSYDINTAGKILVLETGARSLGMGGCGTLLGDASGGLYNPAAQALTADLNGSAYLNPHPHSGPNYDYFNVIFGAHSEFGYLGFSYYFRQGIEGTDYPDEEGSALIIAGKPSRRVDLSLGLAFKILTTSKAGFTPLNESWSKSYKMAFDFGAVYSNLFPQITIGKPEIRKRDPRFRFGRPFSRGIAVGLAFQNLGGRIEYDYSPDYEMLPQTFRSDILWGVYEGRIWDFRVAAQLQKLLVSRKKSDDPDHPLGGYNKATDALFQAWGGGDHEGGWTSRLGFEANLYCLFSGRVGWSVDHKAHRSFIYTGIGLGPEWARLNVVREYEPGSDVDFIDELRFDLTASISYQKFRNWVRK